MSKHKPQPASSDVNAFLAAVADPVRRDDALALTALMQRVTGEPPVMWGASIIGFGRYRYRYESGRTGEACRIGFAARKAELVLYVGASRSEQAAHRAVLGKHRIGKGCLYLKRLSDAEPAALEAIVRNAFAAPPEGEVAE